MKIPSTLLDIAAVFLRLPEAEGRILKRAVMNAGWALAGVGVASLLVMAASGLFLAGIYQHLAAPMSPAGASLLVSLPAFVLAMIFAVIAKWRTADQK